MGSEQHERGIKGPDDFLPELSCPDAHERAAAASFSAGYAQALYDARLIDADEAAEYTALAVAGDGIARIRESASAEASRRLPLDGGTRRLSDLIDKAAFYSAAEDIDVSDMLSALAQAASNGEMRRFKAEWLSPERIGGGEGCQGRPLRPGS